MMKGHGMIQTEPDTVIILSSAKEQILLNSVVGD